MLPLSTDELTGHGLIAFNVRNEVAGHVAYTLSTGNPKRERQWLSGDEQYRLATNFESVDEIRPKMLE